MRERDDQDFFIHTEAKAADFIDPYAIPKKDSIEALKKIRRIENSDGHLMAELENDELADYESESVAEINEKFAKANEDEARFQEGAESSKNEWYLIGQEDVDWQANFFKITPEEVLLRKGIDKSRVRPPSMPLEQRFDEFVEGVDYAKDDSSQENLESLDKNRPNSYGYEKKKEYWYNKD